MTRENFAEFLQLGGGCQVIESKVSRMNKKVFSSPKSKSWCHFYAHYHHSFLDLSLMEDLSQFTPNLWRIEIHIYDQMRCNSFKRGHILFFCTPSNVWGISSFILSEMFWSILFEISLYFHLPHLQLWSNMIQERFSRTWDSSFEYDTTQTLLLEDEGFWFFQPCHFSSQTLV